MPRKTENQEFVYARRMAHILHAIEYKGRYCEICKLDGFDSPWLMDFHHRDGIHKKYEVKNKLYSGSFYSHKEELDKCVLICVSCHRNQHANPDKYKLHQKIILKKLEELRLNGSGKLIKLRLLTIEEQNEILKLIDEGFIMTEIAKKLNINYDTIKYFVKKHKLNPEKRSRPRVSWSLVIKMLNAKHSLRNISDKLNINRETLRIHLSKNVICETLPNGVKRYKRLCDENHSESELATSNKTSP